MLLKGRVSSSPCLDGPMVSSGCLFNTLVLIYVAFGVFQSYYQEHQLKDYTAFQISWISYVVSTALDWIGC